MPKEPKNESAVRDLRKLTGLNQTQFAEMVGCASGTMQNIELGRLPLSPEMAQKIADATGCGLNRADSNGTYIGDDGDVQEGAKPFGVVGIRLTQGTSERPFTHEYFEQWRRWADFRDVFKPYLDRVRDAFEMQAQAAVESGTERGIEFIHQAISELPEQTAPALTEQERARVEEIASECGFLQFTYEGEEESVKETVESSYRNFLYGCGFTSDQVKEMTDDK